MRNGKSCAFSSIASITGATLADRLAAHDAIDAAIEAWTSKLTPAEVERRLTALGIQAAAMRRGNELKARTNGSKCCIRCASRAPRARR